MANGCTIINLHQVRLRFNTVTQVLTARSDQPLVIVNAYLGYEIRYDLKEFEFEFSKANLTFKENITIDIDTTLIDPYHPQAAYYKGSSYFKELHSKKSKLRRFKKRRATVYKTSEMRLSRAIASKSLKQQGYHLFHKGFSFRPEDHIRVSSIKDFKCVYFRHRQYSLLDSKRNQSELYLTDDPIFISRYGTIINGRDIKYSGYMARLCVSGMLPLDYQLEDK